MEDAHEPEPESADDAVVRPVDTWWTVLFIDPIAVRLLRLVAPRQRITPMGITLTAHGLGVATAVLFGAGLLVPAAILYELRFILDCIDGKLARLRGATSAAGGYVDFVGDYLVTAANFGAVGLWLHVEHDLPVVAAAGPALAFLAHMAVRLSSEMQGTMQRIVDGAPSGYVAWMAERRLLPAPSRIDVEHAFLFLAPVAAAVLDAPGLVSVAVYVTTAYFVYVGARFFQGGLALARRDRDR